LLQVVVHQAMTMAVAVEQVDLEVELLTINSHSQVLLRTQSQLAVAVAEQTIPTQPQETVLSQVQD
jgi:hypothetical protein